MDSEGMAVGPSGAGPQRDDLIVPDEWKALDVSRWRGPVLILGGPSSGKSTFGRYLYQQLLPHHKKVAYLDADVGQQDLGPPAAITVAVSGNPDESRFPPTGARRMRFVGSNTPRGHFLPLIMGLHTLQRFARRQGATTTVVDTSGFIEPNHGAAALKWAKVDMLRPCTVVALQRQRELAPILGPLRNLLGKRLHILPVVPIARERTAEERRAHRAACYRAYFQQARRVGLAYGRLAIFPMRVSAYQDFTHGQLLALEDREGFALGLGILDEVHLQQRTIWLHTPWWGEGKIAALRLGKLRLNLETFEDEPIDIL